MTELDYVRENYCSNRDVATGSYDCPYATTVMNTICCTGHECNHKGIYEKPVVNNTKEEMFKLHSGLVYGKSVFAMIKPTPSVFAMIKPTPYEDIAANLLANSLPDDAFPF